MIKRIFIVGYGITFYQPSFEKQSKVLSNDLRLMIPSFDFDIAAIALVEFLDLQKEISHQVHVALHGNPPNVVEKCDDSIDRQLQEILP